MPKTTTPQIDSIFQNIRQEVQENRELIIDLAHKAYAHGVSEGQNHTKPSPDTMVFMQKTNDKLDKLDGDIVGIKSDLHDIKARVPTKEELRAIIAEFKNAIDDNHKQDRDKDIADKIRPFEELRIEINGYKNKIILAVLSAVLSAVAGVIGLIETIKHK